MDEQERTAQIELVNRGDADALQRLIVHYHGPLRRVLAARDVDSRTEIGTEMTPLVGREHELALLAGRWQLTRDGVGQVVLLSGEAGIGKSRLVYELRQRLAPPEVRWLIGYGSPHTSNSPLHPFIGLLRRSLKLDPEVPADQRRVQLEELVRSHELPADATARLARLLSLPSAESDSAPRWSPEQARKRTLEAVAALLVQMAEQQPAVLVIEDLQWADPTTIELLGRLIDEKVPAPLFVLLTFRPSFQAPWGHRSDLTQLHLSRLSAGETALLVDRVCGEGALPAAVRDEIVANADGIPLFVEELTREVTEGQRGSERTIPATLQDSLTAQLDRLGAGKEVAELAAVCGREFSFELLAAASPLAEDLLRRHLDQLVGAQLIQRRGRWSDQRFRFRHALLQEAALNLLLRSTRQDYHHRVATALEERFPAIVDGQPEIVAHHWELAGRPEQAVAYFEQAAAQAQDAYANAEAINFYRRAIELRQRQQEEPEATGASDFAVRLYEGLGDVSARSGSEQQARDAYEAILTSECTPRVEARIRRKIGGSWNVQRRKQEALAALARAEAALGPQPRPTPAWWWEESIQICMEQLSAHYYQAEVDEMTALMERLEPLVPRHGTPVQRAELFTHLLERNLRRERYRLSEETLSYARAALAAYEEVGQSDRIADAKFNVGFVLLFRNQLEEALEVIDTALALTRRLGIASLEGICVAYRTLVYRKRGEVDETHRSCSEIVAGQSPVRRPEYLGLAHGNLAWVAWRRGDLGQVEEHAAAALRCWQQATVSYAMQWTALLPVVAARLAAGQIAAAVEDARRLLDPAQEQLAPPLAATLTQALAAWEQDDDQLTRDRLTATVGLARDLRYL